MSKQSELYQFENNTLYVPYVEAKVLKEKGVVDVLFQVPEVNIYQSETKFDLDDSEPVYPVSINTFYKNKLKIEDKDLVVSGNKKVSYHYAEFWHFLGDGTHSSDLVQTPYDFYPGKELLVENRFNFKAVKCVVTDISLIRFSYQNWFWNIEIHKVDDEV